MDAWYFIVNMTLRFDLSDKLNLKFFNSSQFEPFVNLYLCNLTAPIEMIREMISEKQQQQRIKTLTRF